MHSENIRISRTKCSDKFSLYFCLYDTWLNAGSWGSYKHFGWKGKLENLREHVKFASYKKPSCNKYIDTVGEKSEPI